MPKIYIAPSTQQENVGVGDYSTEEQRMHEIADIVVPELQKYGFTVYRGRKEQSLWDMIDESNRLKVDMHVSIHSNAHDGKSRGCLALYYPGSVKGKALAEAIYNEVSAITPTADKGFITNKAYIEPRETIAPCAIIEVAFHDNPEDARWILESKREIALAIVRGILKYAGIPEDKPDYEKLYKRLLEELKDLMSKYSFQG